MTQLEANQPVGNYLIRANPVGKTNAGFANNINTAILRYDGAPNAEPNATAPPPSVNPLREQDLVPLTPMPVVRSHTETTAVPQSTDVAFRTAGTPWPWQRRPGLQPRHGVQQRELTRNMLDGGLVLTQYCSEQRPVPHQRRHLPAAEGPRPAPDFERRAHRSGVDASGFNHSPPHQQLDRDIVLVLVN